MSSRLISATAQQAANMTAHFASLPNELICEILKLVQPEDLENFAQISRHVYSLAAPCLIEHRALIRRYHTLRNDTDPRCITDVLSEVLTNPRLGSYIRIVELGLLSNPKAVYTQEELENFTTAAHDSEYLKNPSQEVVLDERNYWCRRIQDGNNDILLAILLPLLPNLSALSAENHNGPIEWYDRAIEQAALATKPVLRKLAHVRLGNPGTYGFNLAEIQRLSSLPSVRVMTAIRASGPRSLYEISPETNSDVTHLKLWESLVDSKVLYEFLRGFAKLQSFTYSHAYSHGTRLDAFLIRSSLLAHCKGTLRNLTLLSPCCSFMSSMGSLKGFETLTDLYTEWSFLIPTEEGYSPQLNEQLPASLVRLKIHDCFGRGKYEYDQVIWSVQYAKEHRLQKLKLLVFAGTKVGFSLETFDWHLAKECSIMGITLIFSPYAPKSGD